MGHELVQRARVGFAAWQRGEFATLEAMLDPEVELLWWEPGEWDCHGREQVLDLLRERYEQGFAAEDQELIDAGDDTVITVSYPSRVGGPEWPDETATVIEFRAGRAIRMQQCRTRAEALRAVGPAPKEHASAAGESGTKLLDAATVLLVQSVSRAIEYYRDALGFEVDHYGALPDHYGYAQRDGCSIHFAHFEGARIQPNSGAAPPDMFDVHVRVEDVEALYDELVGRGAEIVHGPVNQGYGIREFRVRDPHGYILAFGRPVRPDEDRRTSS
jgi:catechol 2,3-dioxygenase-like lactoylglutathione lyase family enzyme